MSKEYDEYLKTHIQYVKKGFEWMKNHDVLKIFSKLNIAEASANIAKHDESKYSMDEYSAYDEYFYGNSTYKDKTLKKFNLAWLNHIHKNPHHWQHWVLNQDDDLEPITLDMPNAYIIEMICDWWSFSWSKDNLFEIFDWYDEHKEYMILSRNTLFKVEFTLNKLKEALKMENPNGKQEDNVNHPSHYNFENFEVIDVIVESLGIEKARAYCQGNIIKYQTRYRFKNGDEDLHKRFWYSVMDELLSACKDVKEYYTLKKQVFIDDDIRFKKGE